MKESGDFLRFSGEELVVHQVSCQSNTTRYVIFTISLNCTQLLQGNYYVSVCMNVAEFVLYAFPYDEERRYQYGKKRQLERRRSFKK